MQVRKDTAPFEHLPYVPFSILGVFCELEKDPTLSRRQQHERLEQAVIRHAYDHNRQIGEGKSEEHILNTDEYLKKIMEAYHKFRAMRTKR